MPRRHTWKAAVVLLALGAIVPLFGLAARAGLLPPAEVVLTKPVSRWGEAPAPTAPDRPVEAAAAPDPAASDAALRVQGGTSGEPDTPTPPTPPLPARAAAPRELAASRESPAPAPTPPTSEHLMRAGREVVKDGIRAPRMVSTWTPREIDALVLEQGGLLVAECRGSHYRVVPEGASLTEATDFVALTQEAQAGISNRGLSVESSPAFQPLVDRLRRRLGARLEEPLWLTVHPSNRLDGEFVSKQLGAIRSLGIDLSSRDDIATIGDLEIGARGVAYLIREVRVGTVSHAFRDPEKPAPRAPAD